MVVGARAKLIFGSFLFPPPLFSSSSPSSSCSSRLDNAHGLSRHEELPQHRPLEVLHAHSSPPKGYLHFSVLLYEPLPLELLHSSTRTHSTTKQADLVIVPVRVEVRERLVRPLFLCLCDIVFWFRLVLLPREIREIDNTSTTSMFLAAWLLDGLVVFVLL